MWQRAATKCLSPTLKPQRWKRTGYLNVWNSAAQGDLLLPESRVIVRPCLLAAVDLSSPAGRMPSAPALDTKSRRKLAAFAAVTPRLLDAGETGSQALPDRLCRKRSFPAAAINLVNGVPNCSVRGPGVFSARIGAYRPMGGVALLENHSNQTKPILSVNSKRKL